MLLSLEAAVRDLELGLVEGLGLVEAVTVGSSQLVRVLVLLSLPGRSVPKLAIAFVATHHRVRPTVHLELLGVAEVGCVVPGAPVRLVVDLGVVVAVARRRHPVVLRLVILRRVEHGTSAIPATADLHGLVLLGDQFGIEPAIAK